jgi:hypothetical protein
MGINSPSSTEDLLITFEIDETHPAWPDVEKWIVRRDPLDFVMTHFSRAEVELASWLELEPDWHYGYPQPNEDSFGFLEATYDLSGYCRHCGVGLKQVAPFQMKFEPKWGRNRILQLNWVFDEYFVTPDVWRDIFEPIGVGCRSVRSPKKGELKTVVQLAVEEKISISTEGMTANTCEYCGRVKYEPVKRGPFPALRGRPTKDIVRTVEYFGSGSSANRGVLVSQRLHAALRIAKVRGASFRPVDVDGRYLKVAHDK